jgi:aspartate-semialdehyde dehydrogenase
VRVPVFRGHAESINVELQRPMSANEARAVLAAAPGVVVYDAPEKNIYPLPIYAAGKDETFVGRIREDHTVEAGLNLWVVSDNLRKGAALNAVQIAERLLQMAS